MFIDKVHKLKYQSANEKSWGTYKAFGVTRRIAVETSGLVW